MRTFAALLVLMIVPVMAIAQWSDNFDSYAVNSQIVGQGGWEEWGLGAGALVVATEARSAPHSVEIVGGTDLVHQYTENTGKWFYSAWQYIPSSMTGTTYWIMLNTYAPPTYFWSCQMGFDAGSGLIQADCGSSNQVVNVHFKTDQWVEIRTYIDFDEDWTATFYNGQILDDPLLADHPTLGGGYQWSMGVFGAGGGVNALGAIDLFANGATETYYDDMDFSAATIWADAKVNGSDAPADINIATGDEFTLSGAFVAGDEMGMDGDVWVAFLTALPGDFDRLLYDGVGGIGGTGWHQRPGWFPLHSGALGANFVLPLSDYAPGAAWIGTNKLIVAVDEVANGTPDISALRVIDSVEFDVVNEF